MNPDEQHLKEWQRYSLELQNNSDYLPREWKLARLESVQNCINNLQEKQKNQL